MKAAACLVVERDSAGRSVLRELRSQTPLTLVPHRSSVTRSGEALVHLVSSASAPLGGDELRLTVRVGAGARLCLRGVAATLALPGQHTGPSVTRVLIEAAAGARIRYLPEPTVVTRRAHHVAELRADLAGDAELRTAEVLVLGRFGEPSGRLTSALHVVRDGVPVLRQTTELGDAELAASPAFLAGHRVLGTALHVGGDTPADPAEVAAGGPWWSRVPLAGGGTLTTALGRDVPDVVSVLAAT